MHRPIPQPTGPGPRLGASPSTDPARPSAARLSEPVAGHPGDATTAAAAAGTQGTAAQAAAASPGLPGHGDAAPRTGADAPAASADGDRETQFARELILARARHASRMPLPVMIVAVLMLLIVWEQGPPRPVAVAWFVAVTGVLIGRTLFMRGILRAETPEDPRYQRIANTVAAVNGIVTGLAAPLFFPYLTLEWKAVTTMLLFGWSIGAIPVSAASPRPFGLYVGPLLLLLAASWALMGGNGTLAPEQPLLGPLVGLGIVMLLGLEVWFVTDGARTFRESFFIRYQNRQLIDELERQREAVVRERDRAQEANRAKSRFLAAASHDLRQPLHSVSVFSAALSLRAHDPRTRELADNISLGIASLGSLLDGLLDVSRLDADTIKPEPTVFAVESVLQAIGAEFAMVAAEKGLTLDVRTEPGLWGRTDRFLLERVLRNLVDNAVKYTPRGGIVLSACGAGADEVELVVRDTGIGVPAAESERIFEEFYQVANPERDRTQGLGLGLAIVKRLAGLLGVGVRMDSRPGEGTTFTLRLARAPAPVRADPSERPAPEAGAETDTDADRLPIGLRVLVVDDESSIRAGMANLCAEWGVIADTAGGIDEALACVAREAPHVLIADYRLRGTETGAALVRALRQRQPGLPAIVITGDTSPDRLREVSSLGVPLLHKPVRPIELRRALIALLDAA